MNFYTADLHLGHDNIRKLSKRPFHSVEEMDRVLIENWNNVVTEKDDVYILGDVSFRCDDPIKYIKQLKGKKHLIVGNHDSHLLKNSECRKMFVEICDLKTIKDHGIKIVCCHYPMVEWDGYYRGVLHFYGHVHNTFSNETTQYAAKMKNAYNVGVDILGYTPRTLQEITGKKCY